MLSLSLKCFAFHVMKMPGSSIPLSLKGRARQSPLSDSASCGRRSVISGTKTNNISYSFTVVTMSEKTKSELFLRIMEDYLYARDQLRVAKGLVSNGVVENVSDELVNKLKDMEETASTKPLKLLDVLFENKAE